MHVKLVQRWLAAGAVVVAVAVATGLILGLLTEVLILLATIVACVLALLPLMMERPDRLHGSTATGRVGWRGRQEA